MEERDALLQGIVSASVASVGAVAQTPGYGDVLKKLIVQGLIKIEELEVEVYCRQADAGAAKKALAGAVEEYKRVMKTETGLSVAPKVVLNEDAAKMLPATCSGGVVLKALGGRVVCDNTLDARVQLVYQERLPVVREMLFGALKK